MQHKNSHSHTCRFPDLGEVEFLKKDLDSGGGVTSCGWATDCLPLLVCNHRKAQSNEVIQQTRSSTHQEPALDNVATNSTKSPRIPHAHDHFDMVQWIHWHLPPHGPNDTECKLGRTAVFALLA